MIAPGVDALLFLGVTLLTLIPWVVSDVLHYPGWYVILGVGVVNGPHLISTWTRVYLVPGERFKRPVRYWADPRHRDGAGHRRRRRRADSAPPRALDHLLLGDLALRRPELGRAAHLPAQARCRRPPRGAAGEGARFSPGVLLRAAPALHGTLAAVRHRGLSRPPAGAAVNGLGALLVALAAVYLVVWFRDGRQRAAHEWVRPAYLAFNFLGFAMPFLVIRDGNSAFGAAALWHAVQYIAIVWLYNDRRYRGGIDPNARLVSWVSQRGRAVGIHESHRSLRRGRLHDRLRRFVLRRTGRSWTSRCTFWTGFTLGHYYLDGIIWKSRRYDLRTLTTNAPAPAVYARRAELDRTARATIAAGGAL